MNVISFTAQLKNNAYIHSFHLAVITRTQQTRPTSYRPQEKGTTIHGLVHLLYVVMTLLPMVCPMQTCLRNSERNDKTDSVR